jgi:hypothetical protein
MSKAAKTQQPRWYTIPVRVLLVTFLVTLLSFAIALLLSIAALVISAKLHGSTPDMRFAYRYVAIPVAVAAGSMVLVLSLVMEVRHYRRSRVLAGIARASQ